MGITFPMFGNFDGGRGRIRTDERTKRADLQSASFSHLDTLPAKNKAEYSVREWWQDDYHKTFFISRLAWTR